MKTGDLSKQLWKDAEKACDSSGKIVEGADQHGQESDSGNLEIHLDLLRHCIETEIKRLHHRTMLQYFRDTSHRHQLEPWIACLDRVMVSWDFPAIRAAYPELAGGADTPVRLLFRENREEIRIGGRIIQPLLQGKTP